MSKNIELAEKIQNRMKAKKTSEDVIRKSPLNEDALDDVSLKDMVPETDKGVNIFEILDECYENAEDFYDQLASLIKRGKITTKNFKTNHFNPLFVGPTGSGKTSMIRQWAQNKGIEVVSLNMMGDALDFLGVKRINPNAKVTVDDNGNTEEKARVETVATKAFDVFLTGKDKILFLDEINKTQPSILQVLYDLISFHVIQNGDEVMYLPKLLFTVGAMNPSTYGGGREELDPALKARMQIYKVSYDTQDFATYMKKQYEDLIEDTEYNIQNTTDEQKLQKLQARYQKQKGTLDLIAEIFQPKNMKKFQWTEPEDITNMEETEACLTPRTLDAAFANCKGTKDGLINAANRLCGPLASSQLANFLTDYREKEHIANTSLKKALEDNAKADQLIKDLENKGEKSDIAGTKPSALDRLKNQKSKLGM